MDGDLCARIVREALPEVTVRSLRPFASGWDYELWEMNDGLLLRFPSRDECAAPLLVEARLLAELADELSFPVPTPVFTSEGCASFPLPFFAYQKLPGVPLEESGLDGERRAAVHREMGRFLTELHAFPPERAAALSVPAYSPETWRAEYRAFREEIRRDVLPLMTEGEAAAVEEFWASFLADDALFEFTPVLIHSDFDGAHVLVDANSERITGVIDFGDTRVGDPALDFAGCSGDLREQVLAAYQLPVDGTLLERADIYRNRIGPFYALRYGLGPGDPVWVERGLAAIRAEFGSKKHK